MEIKLSLLQAVSAIAIAALIGGLIGYAVREEVEKLR